MKGEMGMAQETGHQRGGQEAVTRILLYPCAGAANVTPVGWLLQTGGSNTCNPDSLETEKPTRHAAQAAPSRQMRRNPQKGSIEIAAQNGVIAVGNVAEIWSRALSETNKAEIAAAQSHEAIFCCPGMEEGTGIPTLADAEALKGTAMVATDVPVKNQTGAVEQGEMAGVACGLCAFNAILRSRDDTKLIHARDLLDCLLGLNYIVPLEPATARRPRHESIDGMIQQSIRGEARKDGGGELAPVAPTRNCSVPDAALGTVCAMGQCEAEPSLERWNGTAAPYSSGGTAPWLFEASALRRCSGVSVVFEGEAVSYGGLEASTSRLAAVLVVELGVGPDSVVGLCVEKSVEEVAGMVGIMRAGGAYVPLDPGLPGGRLGYLVGQRGCGAVVAQRRFGGVVDGFIAHTVHPAAAMMIVVAEEALCGATASGVGSSAVASSLAYVLFTSGSTGRPKGVMVQHGSLVSCVSHSACSIGLRYVSAILYSTAFTFDVSGDALLRGIQLAHEYIGRPVLTDTSANGFGRSECSSALILRIAHLGLCPRAMFIKGTAVNQGDQTASFMAPGGLAQQHVVKAALYAAGCGSAGIHHSEAHETGTALGDPIEVGALFAVFGDMQGSMVLGAFKSQVGHTGGAAGMAGLLKLLIALQHHSAPPNLHLRKVNGELKLDKVAAIPTSQAVPLSFGFPELRRGGLPGVVSVAAQRRMKAVQFRRAVLSGEPFDAACAQQLGLVDIVAPSVAEAKKEVESLMQRLRSIQPSLLSICKTRFPMASVPEALVTMGERAVATQCPEQLEHTSLVQISWEQGMDGVAVLVLNNPDSYNELDLPMMDALHQAIRGLKNHMLEGRELHAVILRGAGKHFCVGVGHKSDSTLVASLQACGFSMPATAALIHRFARAMTVLRILPTSLIGGAVALALNTDWGIATSATSFCHGNLPRGMNPIAQFSQSLVRLVGLSRVSFMYFEDVLVQASSAHKIGLVDAVTGDLETGNSCALQVALQLQPLGYDVWCNVRLADDFQCLYQESAMLAARYIDEFAPIPESSLTGICLYQESAMLAARYIDEFAPIPESSLTGIPQQMNQVSPSSHILAELVDGHEDPAVFFNEILQNLTRDIIGNDLIMLDSPLMESGMDSLAATEFINMLSRALGRIKLNPTLVFDYPTIRLLTSFLVEIADTVVVHQSSGSSPEIAEICVPLTHSPSCVVVGTSSIGPDHDLAQGILWGSLCCAGNRGCEIPATRFESHNAQVYIRHGHFLHGAEVFDAPFFSLSQAEVRVTDPSQRILLETVYCACVRAHFGTASLAQTNSTGMLLGMCNVWDWQAHLQETQQSISTFTMHGLDAAAAAGRVSYLFGLKGPCCAINTACSSALVALDVSYVKLNQLTCQQTVVAGVCLHLHSSAFAGFCALHALSPDGECKTFDARADGYARAEACGAVFLKQTDWFSTIGVLNNVTIVGQCHNHPLCISGSATNQDGRSASFMAPNGRAQEDVLLASRQSARQPLVLLSETHGTGTTLGDPIEVGALQRVRADLQPGVLMLFGARKSQVAHAEGASGMVGLIKGIFELVSFQHPPNLHLSVSNSKLDLSFSVTLPSQTTASLHLPGSPEIQQDKKFIGVSSFGFTGTNANAVLEDSLNPDTLQLQSTPTSNYCKTAFPWHQHAQGPPASHLLGPAVTPEVTLGYICDATTAWERLWRTVTCSYTAQGSSGSTAAVGCSAILSIADEAFSGSQPFPVSGLSLSSIKTASVMFLDGLAALGSTPLVYGASRATTQIQFMRTLLSHACPRYSAGPPMPARTSLKATMGDTKVSDMGGAYILMLTHFSKHGIQGSSNEQTLNAVERDQCTAPEQFEVRSLADMEEYDAEAVLEQLVVLEQAWPIPMRQGPGVLSTRMQQDASWLLVLLDISADHTRSVVGSLYTQRISSVDSLYGTRYSELVDLYKIDGPVLQLVGIQVNARAPAGAGTLLLDKAFYLAGLHGIHTVAAVTRCRTFSVGSMKVMEALAAMQLHVYHGDPGVQFHTGRGAMVRGLVPNYRTEDANNAGIGVLVEYSLDEPSAGQKNGTAPLRPRSGQPSSTRDVLANITEAFRHYPAFSAMPLHGGAAESTFGDVGLDSFDLMKVTEELSTHLGIELPTSTLYEYNTFTSLLRHLESEAATSNSEDTVPQSCKLSSKSTCTLCETLLGDSITHSVCAAGMSCRLLEQVSSPTQLWQRLFQGQISFTSALPERWTTLCRGAGLDHPFPGSFIGNIGELLYPELASRLPLDVKKGFDAHIHIIANVMQEALSDITVPTLDWGMFSAVEFERMQNQIDSWKVSWVIANLLRLFGPHQNFDVTCASGYLGIIAAIDLITSTGAEGCVVGGVGLSFKPGMQERMLMLGVISRSGCLRPLDVNADGTIIGEGCGAITLHSNLHPPDWDITANIMGKLSCRCTRVTSGSYFIGWRHI